MSFAQNKIVLTGVIFVSAIVMACYTSLLHGQSFPLQSQSLTFDPLTQTGQIPLQPDEFNRWKDIRFQHLDLPWIKDLRIEPTFRRLPLADPQYSLVQESSRLPALYHERLYFRLPDRIETLLTQHLPIDFSASPDAESVNQVLAVLQYFPEIISVGISDYHQGTELNTLLMHLQDLLFLGALKISGERPLSRTEMESLSKLKGLRRIVITGSAKQPELATLHELELLESFKISSSIGPECFLAFSQLSRLEQIWIGASFDENTTTDQSMNVPISEDIAAAIESLDGRLKTIVFEQYVPVHPSIVRALSKVRSLERIEMDEVGYGLRMDDIASFAELDNLTRFSISQHPSQSDLQHPGYEETMQLKASIRQRAEERRQERVQRTMQEVERQKSQGSEERCHEPN